MLNTACHGYILHKGHKLSFTSKPIIACENRIPFPHMADRSSLIKPLRQTLYCRSGADISIHFQESSRITDYHYSRPWFYLSEKVFSQGSSADISCLAIWENDSCRTRTEHYNLERVVSLPLDQGARMRDEPHSPPNILPRIGCFFQVISLMARYI